MASTPRMTHAGNSAGFPPIALSIAARMICGEIMSARAASAAQSMLMMKKRLLPFRKRRISAQVALFFCLFSVFSIILPKQGLKSSKMFSARYYTRCGGFRQPLIG